jgi:hypothetical protein
MYSTEQYSRQTHYFANPALWANYKPVSFVFVIRKWDFEREYGCSDYLAREINKASKEAETPGEHTTYNTVEEFLVSLKNR